MTRNDTGSRFPTIASFALIAVVALGVAALAFAGGAAAQSGGNFQVTIDDTNSPVAEGETLTVDVTVKNTGNQSDTQTVNLTVGGTVRDSTTVSLGADNSTTETLTWQTGDGDAGDYQATVASENDTDSTSVSVEGPANFVVDINGTNSPVTENDTLEVEAIIRNRGDRTDNQEVVLETEDGVRRDSTTVALDPGARATRTLTWETDPGDAGDHTVNVSTEDDFETQDVTVQEVSSFDVTIDSTNEPVAEGNALRVEATVENTDTTGDTQDIALGVDGSQRDATTVDLNSGDSTTVTLEWSTSTGDAGDYVANVSSETDTASADVAVNAPPSASFTRDPANPNVNQAVTFDAADSDDRDGSVVSYTWSIDGENVSGSETFSYTFTEAGDHEVTLYVTDDDGATTTATRTVSVNAPPDVSIAAVDATVGEEVTVDATVSDDGTISRYEWYVDEDLVSTSETLTYTFDESGTHQVRLQVTDDDGATSATTTAVDVQSDATPTEVPDTSTETASETASPSAEDQPGFGAAIAVAAVLATALLARRRR